MVPIVGTPATQTLLDRELYDRQEAIPFHPCVTRALDVEERRCVDPWIGVPPVALKSAAVLLDSGLQHQRLKRLFFALPPLDQQPRDRARCGSAHHTLPAPTVRPRSLTSLPIALSRTADER